MVAGGGGGRLVVVVNGEHDASYMGRRLQKVFDAMLPLAKERAGRAAGEARLTPKAVGKQQQRLKLF